MDYCQREMRMPSKILLNILFFKTVKVFQCQWIGLTLLAWSQSNLSNVSNTSSGLLTLNTSLAPKLRAWMDKLLESHCCVHNGLYKQVYMKIPPHEETVWAKHYFPKSFPRVALTCSIFSSSKFCSRVPRTKSFGILRNICFRAMSPQ